MDEFPKKSWKEYLSGIFIFMGLYVTALALIFLLGYLIDFPNIVACVVERLP